MADANHSGPRTGPLSVSPPPLPPLASFRLPDAPPLAPPEGPPPAPPLAPPLAPPQEPPSRPRSPRPRSPHRAPSPRPASRTWWILPYCAGLVAVLVVAAAVIFVRPSTGSGARAANPTASATRTGPPMPAELFPGTLFATLTKDIQAGHETGFLALAAASARPAMRTWWENLRAIGFTTGAVIPTASQDVVHINAQGNGSTVVLAGTHSPLDPAAKGKPYVPLERYRIGLHFASAKATGQITSWQSLASAPWDASARLYVRKAANVVVAGLPGDSALVDETLPIAQAAANYDIGLVTQANPNDLNSQQGFVVFVSGSAAVRNRWLATGTQVAGWPPQFLQARMFALPGPGLSPADVTSAGALADGTVGGARVVVAPYTQDSNGGDAHSQEVTLVRDFMLAILASHDEALVNGTKLASAPLWTTEGLAVAVQELFEASINPAPARYDFSRLTGGLRKLPARPYRSGKVPTGQQLFSSSLSSSENWNEVAASVYEYIELKYGINQMLASAVLAWTRYSTPFGNVLASSSGSTYTFYTSATVKAGWRAWLAGL